MKKLYFLSLFAASTSVFAIDEDNPTKQNLWSFYQYNPSAKFKITQETIDTWKKIYSSPEHNEYSNRRLPEDYRQFLALRHLAYLLR